MAVYELMKDSKLPWIGAIPSHWHIIRIKELMQNVSEKNRPNATVLSLYREHGVLPKDSRDDNHNVTSLDTASYKFVRIGELVINKMKAWQGSLGVSDYEGIVSPAYYVCRFTSDKINTKYFHYLIRCKAYAQEFERLSTGMRVGQWDLGIDDFMCTPAIIPPIDEQSAIASYLDDQCAKIDSLIAEAKASIEEYKKWKSSLIFEAVTKGLDPNVEMKDSGVDWIGKIPATWKIEKIKNLGKARNGLTFSPSDITGEDGVLVIRSSNIQEGKWNYSDNVYVNLNIPEDLILQNGDIVICSRNGSRRLIGKNAIVEDADGKKTFGAFMMIYRTVISNKRYVYWLLNSGVFEYYLPMFFTSTINQLTRTHFNEMLLPFAPSKEDQQKIVEFLDLNVSTIDTIIESKNTLIEDLESYKKSLIYEVVTGKRKVV